MPSVSFGCKQSSHASKPNHATTSFNTYLGVANQFLVLDGFTRSGIVLSQWSSSLNRMQPRPRSSGLSAQARSPLAKAAPAAERHGLGVP